MLSLTTLALSALPLALAQSNNDERILGVYMFHRHGDRTAKATAPANLTDLGYRQVYDSGAYYRNRYIASDAGLKINGINSDLVKQSQINVLAPDDDVLQNSATGFLQGLYPPVGNSLATSTLRNGTEISAPLQGYQLIPVGTVESGEGSEDSGWLQSAQGCSAATASSNNYFLSQEYQDLLSSTQDFYDALTPVINGSFASSQISFKNAYTIYDLINVAEIHNETFDSSDLVTDDRFRQLHLLANAHEWGLAYNSSDDARAIAGMTLAGEIVDFLNNSISDDGASKIGVQFGSYGTFSSFFGLADLPSTNDDFYGITDYASSMAFELFTNYSAAASSSDYPSSDDIYVRFFFHNGTTSESSEPVQYPLFGSGQDALSWDDFLAGMNEFAISTDEQWCNTCGNTDDTCAAYSSASSGRDNGNSASSSSSTSGNGLSPAVNGVIGAMVTLAVVLGLEAMLLLVCGLRVVSKKQLAGGAGQAAVSGGEAKTA